jgi:diguanylate cyclase (GGDEF)-like protein/PAS domain S-box-containing protein
MGQHALPRMETRENNYNITPGIPETICSDNSYNNEINSELYRRVFNQSYQFMSVLDADGKVMTVNQTAIDFIMTDEKNITGKPLWEAPWCQHSKEEQKKIQDGIVMASRGFFIRFETTQCIPGKELHYIDFSLKPIFGNDGKVQIIIQEGRDITERKHEEMYLQKIATHDPLTGLPNMRLLYDRLNQAIVRAYRSDKIIAVLFIDLDSFKQINDSMGHSKGDQMLLQVSERLVKSVREIDTVSRLGGDEFVIVLEDVLDLDNINAITKRLIYNITKPYDISGRSVLITASIGISIFPYDSTDPEILLQKADNAMYQVKHTSKNDYKICM